MTVESILSSLTLPILANQKNTVCSFSTLCARRKATFFDRQTTNMQERSESGPQIAAEVVPVNGAATSPAVPAVHRGARRRFLIELLIGFSVLVLGLLAGEQLKMWLHLPVPGNVLGLFLLLLSFRLRLLSPQLIEKAANLVLYVLPSLFIPIYVSAIGQGQLWSQMSWILVPMLLLVTAGLWIFVGHLAQKLLRQPVKDE